MGPIRPDNPSFQFLLPPLGTVACLPQLYRGKILILHMLYRQYCCRLGDIEHLREALDGEGVELKAGQMYWLTNR